MVRGFGGELIRLLAFHLQASKVPSSIPSKVDSSPVLVWKEYSQRFAKVVGFLRVLRFPPTGKVDRVG